MPPCLICKNISGGQHLFGPDEIMSPEAEKLVPLWVTPEKKAEPYNSWWTSVKFMKCPECNAYYHYDNWPQGIGNIGDFEILTRFTDEENRLLRPIFESTDATTLEKSLTKALTNEQMTDKVYRAFEAVMGKDSSCGAMLPVETTFPVLKNILLNAEQYTSYNRYWASGLLDELVKSRQDLATPEIKKLIEQHRR